MRREESLRLESTRARLTMMLVAALIVGGTLVAATLVRGDRTLTASPGTAAAHPPFYLEAIAEVDPDPRGDGIERRHVTLLRWWFLDTRHWRWEAESLEPAIEAGVYVAVRDGGDLWGYDSRTNAYTQAAPDPGMDAFVAGPTALSAPFGPANVGSVDELIEAYEGRGGTEAHIAGEDEVLGRRVVVIEYGPVWRSSGSDGGEQSGGVGRMWVDPDAMLILRHEVDGGDGGQSFRIESTRLDEGAPPDAAAIGFTPPAGAERIEHTGSCTGSGSGSAGGAGIDAPAGWLRADYLPDGFEQVASGSSTSEGCIERSFFAVLRDGGGRTIRFEQQRNVGGLPDALRTGERGLVGAHEAYRVTEGATERLAWADGDVVALLESDAVPFDELLRIATSTRRVPGG